MNFLVLDRKNPKRDPRAPETHREEETQKVLVNADDIAMVVPAAREGSVIYLRSDPSGSGTVVQTVDEIAHLLKELIDLDRMMS